MRAVIKPLGISFLFSPASSTALFALVCVSAENAWLCFFFWFALCPLPLSRRLSINATLIALMGRVNGSAVLVTTAMRRVVVLVSLFTADEDKSNKFVFTKCQKVASEPDHIW